MKQFNELGLSEDLLITIKKLGITKPTEIQEKCIPLIMEGKDMMGQSSTGSGKTIAFGSGIIEHVEPKRGIQALVMTPTRELAEQVTGVLKILTGKKRLKIISVYGGVAINPQIHDLAYADVVVGTPGRLLDHLERRTINTSKVKLLVLDEADRMLDMGFIDDVERIMRTCPQDKQTLFFSATTSTSIKRLINKHMHNPIEISATKMVDPSKLKQVYYNVTRNTKLSLLVHLLKNEDAGLVMVFCNTRRTTDFIVKNLRGNQVQAIAIHGGLSQNKRTQSIDMFNNAKAGILVCTDVAARGLHIDNVSHIYNYEIPKDPKDYVHRIGRTARAGEKGKVINLLSDENHGEFGRIQAEYRTFIIDRIETPQLERITIRNDNSRGSRGSFGRNNYRNDRGNNRSGGFRGRSSSGGGFRGRSSSDGNSQGGSSGGFRGRSSSGGSSRGDSSGGFRDRSSSGGSSRGDSSGGFRGRSSSGGSSRGDSSGGFRGRSSSGGSSRGDSSGGFRGRSSSDGNSRGGSSGGFRGRSSSDGNSRGGSSGGFRGRSSSGGSSGFHKKRNGNFRKSRSD